MTTPTRNVARTLAALAAGSIVLSIAGLAGCASDEPGHSKTQTKTTVQTPSGKTTTTETHEKDTTIIR